jgi:hypothetical protein
MQKIVFYGIVLIFLIVTGVSFAEENNVQNQMSANPKATHMAVGIDLSQLQSDYGMGISFTSPAFANGYMAVRAHGGIAMYSGIPENKTEYDVMNYVPVRLGFVISVGMLNGLARFYSEPGLLVMIPDDKFSDKIATGGYGLIGFECFTAEKSPVTYFLEAGGYGSSGNADKLAGKPVWGSGFMLEVGVRMYF